MSQKNHRGKVLRYRFLRSQWKADPTIAWLLMQLGVSRVALSRLLNGKAGVSVDMAIRLGEWLGTRPEVWLRMQDACGLWQARKSRRSEVKPLQRNEIAGN